MFAQPDSLDSPSLIEYRNPSGALLRSFVMPGWGQFYNNEPGKGLIYGAIELGLLGMIFYENDKSEYAREMYQATGLISWQNSYDFHSSLRRDFVWYTAGAWLVGMLDAYVDAYLFSFDAENKRFDENIGFSFGAAINF